MRLPLFGVDAGVILCDVVEGSGAAACAVAAAGFFLGDGFLGRHPRAGHLKAVGLKIFGPVFRGFGPEIDPRTP